MMTDQELIDGLRAELDGLQVPGDLLDRLWAEAGAGGQGSARTVPPRRRRTRRSVWTWAAAAVSLAVVGAVVVIVLSAGHPGQVSQKSVSGAESARTRLLASLAVLRRPQRPADLQPRLFVYHPERLTRPQMKRSRLIPFSMVPGEMRRWYDPELDRPLTRVVNLPGSSAEVMIAPAVFRPSHRSKRRILGLDLTIGTHGAGREGTGPRPTTVASFLAHGLAVWTPDPRGPYEQVAVLVPDGVERVVLRDLRPERVPGGIRRRVQAQTSRVARAGVVHDNVALVRIPNPVVTLAKRSTSTVPFGTFAVARADWVGTSGRVIRRTSTSVGLTVRFTHTGARNPAGRRQKIG